MPTTVSPSPYPVIGPESHFYGYVTGLSIQPRTDDEEIPRRLLATFEYSGKPETWEVPSLELFEALWQHLRGNAWHRKNTDEWGYDKVWISRTDAGWHVELP